MTKMREISTLEVAAILKELNNINDLFIDKFYLISEDEFRFKLSKSGVKINVQCKLCHNFSQTEYVKSVDNDSKSTFESAVRKRIGNFYITGITQPNDDRIINLKIKKGDTEKNVIIEMFAKGNLIIANSNYKIELVYKPKTFKDRSIEINEIYKPPEKSEITISDLKGNEFIKKLIDIYKNSNQSIKLIKFLNKLINIGVIYIEDSIIQNKIDPNIKLSDVNENMLKSIILTIKEKVNYIDVPLPTLYFDNDDNPIDFSICPLSKYSDYKSKTFDRIGKMLDTLTYENDNAVDTPVSKKAKETEISIQKQKEIIQSMHERINYDKEAGKIIFTNMNLINQVINFASSNKHLTLDQLKEQFPYLNIKEVDLVKKTITLEF